jgi:cysteine-S-conjugate beta-lyase
MSGIEIPLPVDPLDVLRQRRSAKWRRYPDDVLPLPVAEMDFPLAPAIRDVLLDAVRRSDVGYAMPEPDLGRALSEFAAARWDWSVDPDSIRPATDVGVACVDMLRVLCRPGDAVVVNSPVYAPFFHWIEETGTRCLEAPLRQASDGSWRLDLAGLADAFAQRPAAYILCNPHNPVGRVHTPEELAEVARLANEYDVPVISDEVHAPLVLPGATFTPFLTMPGATDIAVGLHSASKAWNLAGLKCAAIVTASPAMAARVERRPADARWRIGHFGALASIAAYDDGIEWLDALLATLDLRRRQLGELLSERVPDISWTPPEATFLAWLDCRRLVSEGGAGRSEPDAAQRLLLERGRVAVEPGAKFGGPGDGWVRLNFGTSAEILEAAVDRMARAVA